MCKVGANAIRLHDEVVSLLERLFRSLRVDAIVESMHIFAEASAIISDLTFYLGTQGALVDK